MTKELTVAQYGASASDAAPSALLSAYGAGLGRERRYHVAQDLARCSTPQARARLPEARAVAWTVLPLSIVDEPRGSVLVVCVGGEATPELLARLRFATGLEISAESAPAQVVSRAITAAYRGCAVQLAQIVEELRPPRAETTVTPVRVLSDAPLPKLLDSVLHQAAAMGASDVHLRPERERLRVDFRIDGEMREQRLDIPRSAGAALSRRVKVLAGLDSASEREAQEGAFRLSDSAIRVRVAIVPLLDGEKVTMRLLCDDAAEPQSFAELGLLEYQRQQLAACLALESGVLLFSGPTGSGKSTLLAEALRLLADGTRHVVSIEDPVERHIPGVTQLQVAHDRGLTFEGLLTAALRHDPDVIMLGEMRERHTAETVLTAGVTGHLVMSTVHAGNSVEVLLRLSHLGVSWGRMAAAIKLVSSQRLVPRNCLECLEAVELGAPHSKILGTSENLRVYRGIGCKQCGGTGTRGRIGVVELLPIGSALRTLLGELHESGQANSAAPYERLWSTAAASNYQPLSSVVLTRLRDGEIGPDAAVSALGISLATLRRVTQKSSS